MCKALSIMANQDAMSVIDRAREIAQNMFLPYVVPHTLFLALYEEAKKDIAEVLQGAGIDCSQYCKKVAAEINSIPKKAVDGVLPFHPALNAVLNKALEYERPCTIRSLIASLLASDGIRIDKSFCAMQDDYDPFAELDALIGLESVKTEVKKLVELVKFNEARRKAGLPADAPTNHFVFTGNPGTGKTTVARIIARIYKKLCVLKRGHLVEVDRSKLVAGYVGQTAIQTNAVIDAALDGVLFIDETYSLSSGGRSDYGGEAIATLLKRMEDQRDRMVVIVAGYEGEMEQFINSNPGLKSRFTKYIHFPDYTSKDLTEIFVALAKNQGYGLGTKEMLAIEEYMNQAVIEAKSGNARIARNLLSVVKERMALRVMADGSANKSELSRIMVEDIR